MFRTDDRAAYVKSLQRMLLIPETGRISEEMRMKIRALQERHGYPASGKVDYRTHLLIRNGYHESVRKNAFKKVIKPYDVSDDIVELNRELSVLIRLYGLRLRVPRGRVLGFDSVRVIERLRELYRLPHGNTIDYELHDRIKRDILSMSANNKGAGIG